MVGSRTTIAGVIGEQLPRHPEWEIEESTEDSCFWGRVTRVETGPQSIALSFDDGEWTASIRRVTYDEEGVPTYAIEMSETDSIFTAIETLRGWMNEAKAAS